ncbi:MAG: hemolysin family protein [Acidobacteriota bacterium]|nr:hemolysin family protein [Acidobacteriota bacterium]
MSVIAFEVILVLLLIFANGVFAMSEMAIVSARKIRLQQLADGGDKAARTALKLANNPDRFFSTMQIGITLIGILAGAFGGATISEQLALIFNEIPALAPYGEALGLTIVVVAITYLSLIIGELVPKGLALSNAERIAALVAQPMNFLSWLASPLVSFLSYSTSFVFKLLRLRPSLDPPVTEEEIKILVEQGTQAGVFEETEQDLVGRVFRLADRRVSALMTPRPDIFWLDLDAPEQEILQEIAAARFSRFPVARGSVDNIVGVVKAKDYLTGKLNDPAASLESFLKEPLYVPETSSAFQVLELFKSRNMHLALVIDEYGALEGLVTTNDFLEAITGEPAQADAENAPIVQREDGSWLVDAALLIDEFEQHFAVKLSDEAVGYQTLAGFLLAQFGHIPKTAEVVEFGNLRFEIVDMDGRRIDEVLVSYIERERETE